MTDIVSSKSIPDNNLAELRTERGYMLSRTVRDLLEERDVITRADLIALGHQEERFAWVRRFPMTKEEVSFHRIERDDETIGEYVFAASADGLLSPFAYGFEAKIVFRTGLIELNFTYGDRTQSLIPQLERYFERRGDDWRWRSMEARGDLYRAMEARDPSLPQELIDLYEGWNTIIDSFAIHCE